MVGLWQLNSKIFLLSVFESFHNATYAQIFEIIFAGAFTVYDQILEVDGAGSHSKEQVRHNFLYNTPK